MPAFLGFAYFRPFVPTAAGWRHAVRNYVALTILLVTSTGSAEPLRPAWHSALPTGGDYSNANGYITFAWEREGRSPMILEFYGPAVPRRPPLDGVDGIGSFKFR